jgi:hypothetical protein
MVTFCKYLTETKGFQNFITLKEWAQMLELQMNGPQPNPLLGPLYFISFILIGVMLMLNLVIGVVFNSMEKLRTTTPTKKEKPAKEAQHRSLLLLACFVLKNPLCSA